MFKSLLIFILLVIWKTLADSIPCVVFAVYVAGITTLLTIVLSETKIINKYVIAERVFHNETSLFIIFKSAWFTLFTSLLIAFITSIILLIQSIYFNLWIFFILGIDIIVIWLIHNKIKTKLSLSVKSPFLEPVARRWATWINSLLLVIIFVIYQFFTTPTNEVQIISCKTLDFLSSTLRYKELIEWKLVSSSINILDYNNGFYGWIFYLLISQSIFAWTYTKLLLSVDISKSIIKTDKNIKSKNYFIIGFIGAILLLLISTLIINHLYEKKHIQKIERLVKEAYVEIDNTLNEQLEASKQKVLDEIDKIIDQQIDIAFTPVYYGVPSLSSYYYSVKGEYIRIALKGNDVYCEYKNGTLVPYYNQFLPNGYKLKRCNDKMLDIEIQSRISQYLFRESNFSIKMNKASLNINTSISNNITALQNELQASVELFKGNTDISTNKEMQSQLHNLNSEFDEIFEASSRDIAKKSLSGTGAVLLTSSISKTIMSKMLLKLGAKGAGKVATFAAGSATGLTVCAPSGPWAVLCGVLTGTVAWAGTDAAITEIDQAFNEDNFQLSVRKMIDSEKNTLKSLMKVSYHKWILEVFEELNESKNNLKSPNEQLQTQLSLSNI